MALAGNIALIEVTDAEVEARRSALHHYRAASQTSWADQRAAAKVDALSDFHAMRGFDPDWVIAERDDSWKRVLVYYTLTLIFAGVKGDDARAEEARWRSEAARAMDSFRFRVDADQDGAVEDTEVSEAAQVVREIVMLR